MKQIFILALFFGQLLQAQKSFDKGNALYQSGKYEQAIVVYEEILNTNMQSAELFFNLGNSYYKLHKIASSIYYYEKALLLDPNSKEIQNNLNIAQKMNIDDIKETKNTGFFKLFSAFTSAFSYNTWALISILIVFLFLISFIGYYFSLTTRYKRFFFVTMFIFIVGVIISVIISIYEKNYYYSERPAIIFSEVTSLKSEPQSTGNTIMTLHEGTKIYIIDSLANWRKVQLLDQTKGWIEKSTFKEIKKSAEASHL